MYSNRFYWSLKCKQQPVSSWFPGISASQSPQKRKVVNNTSLTFKITWISFISKQTLTQPTEERKCRQKAMCWTGSSYISRICLVLRNLISPHYILPNSVNASCTLWWMKPPLFLWPCSSASTSYILLKLVYFFLDGMQIKMASMAAEPSLHSSLCTV